MRIFIFLLISGLFHFALMHFFYFTFDEVQIINNNESMSVVLLNSKSFNQNLSESKLSASKKIDPIDAEKESSSFTKAINPNPIWEAQHKALDLNPNQENISLKDYYPVAEVDRKALPQMNIDQSMLANVEASGLPIKLRLYINAFGRVVKVDPIAVLDQDVLFAEKLASLLYKVRFLPAKREGLDVDSYQDLQLSFNPIVAPGDSHN